MRENPSDVRETAETATRASWMTSERFLWVRVYALAATLALVFSFTSAAGTGNQSLVVRLIYWMALMLGGTAIAYFVDSLMEKAGHLFRKQSHRVIIHAFLIIVPITLFVWGVNSVMAHSLLGPSAIFTLLGYTVPICLAMAGIRALMHPIPLQSQGFPPNAAQSVAFRERLPFKFQQADIYAVSAEDHYLRVYTAAGQTLILMRLYDGIKELEGIAGTQTHRSWWVALSAVRDIEKKDGKVCLVLADGTRAPVSRRFQKALRAEGWI
ncbi:MAG: LytTR family DNA-binding domain-containing protein [Asticcacaulis sp.]